MNPTARPTLADRHYYLSNFRLVLDWLEDRYGDLLDDGQRRFCVDFKFLAKASQALLVRMVMRKADLFRATKLQYPEIGPTEEAIAPLIALGWAEEPGSLTLDELFVLLRKDELARWDATDSSSCRSGRRRRRATASRVRADRAENDGRR